jgi:hypothetical protein
MSEKGSEPDIETRRFNVAEVPVADIKHVVEAARCQKRTFGHQKWTDARVDKGGGENRN